MQEQPILGVVMDPISGINPKKDTTLALLLKAQMRGFELHYMEISDLFLQYGNAWGNTRPLTVSDNPQNWYTLGESNPRPLDQFDILLMRKDPPVTMDYLYATYVLEHAEQNGVLVLNKPQSLRDANEKMFATWFPQCMPPTLVSASPQQLKSFLSEQGTVVFKPLDEMGGQRVFKCEQEDPNLSVILEVLTHSGTRYTMAQHYIPDIMETGDKRIFLVEGEPIPYGLARQPAATEFRANLAAGGTGIGVKLNERDLWICSQIGPTLREKGLFFVGIDVIGEYLTEINVTSPTCVREVEAYFDIDITGRILDCLVEKLQE